MSATDIRAQRFRDHPWVLAIAGGLIVNFLWWIIFSSPVGRSAFLGLGFVTKSLVDAAFAAAPDERQDSGFTLIALQVVLTMFFVIIFPVLEMLSQHRTNKRKIEEVRSRIANAANNLHSEPEDAPTIDDANGLALQAKRLDRGFYALAGWIIFLLAQLAYVNVTSSVSGLAHATYSRWASAAAPCLTQSEGTDIRVQWALTASRADYEKVLGRIQQLQNKAGVDCLQGASRPVALLQRGLAQAVNRKLHLF